jgi:hypothetical protein
MKTHVLLIIALVLCTDVLTMDLRWQSCPIPVNFTECATTTVKLVYNDPTSKDIPFFVRRYTSPAPIGTIVVLGGLFVCIFIKQYLYN